MGAEKASQQHEQQQLYLKDALTLERITECVYRENLVSIQSNLLGSQLRKPRPSISPFAREEPGLESGTLVPVPPPRVSANSLSLPALQDSLKAKGRE